MVSGRSYRIVNLQYRGALLELAIHILDPQRVRVRRDMVGMGAKRCREGWQGSQRCSAGNGICLAVRRSESPTISCPDCGHLRGLKEKSTQ
jgi:DNA-directed RNA polymerase subunit RPC12/RpoP